MKAKSKKQRKRERGRERERELEPLSVLNQAMANGLLLIKANGQPIQNAEELLALDPQWSQAKGGWYFPVTAIPKIQNN